ncbi:hypothetical protein GCM10009747_12490 [Agromyces humatus]|uniref:Uncharacterized protein n=2 Tax=Agromyces humatus TaxID=279573 RepID=A0ABP4WJ19_9MICO
MPGPKVASPPNRKYGAVMSKLTEKVKSVFRKRRPVTPEDAAEIADWVNEGGAADPEGPPRVIDPKSGPNGPKP